MRDHDPAALATHTCCIAQRVEVLVGEPIAFAPACIFDVEPHALGIAGDVRALDCAVHAKLRAQLGHELGVCVGIDTPHQVVHVEHVQVEAGQDVTAREQPQQRDAIAAARNHHQHGGVAGQHVVRGNRRTRAVHKGLFGIVH